MRRPRKIVSSKASRWKTSMGAGRLLSGSIVREFVRVGEANGSVGAQQHGVRVETEAKVGVALPVLAIVARLVAAGAKFEISYCGNPCCGSHSQAVS